jgi:hypothetical protein
VLDIVGFITVLFHRAMLSGQNDSGGFSNNSLLIKPLVISESLMLQGFDKLTTASFAHVLPFVVFDTPVLDDLFSFITRTFHRYHGSPAAFRQRWMSCSRAGLRWTMLAEV